MDSLTFFEEDRLRAALDDLRRSDSQTNWVLLGYKNKTTVELLDLGNGGLEELQQHLGDDDIRYCVLEVMVTGDAYNAVKYVLITWIGSAVAPGLAKARCAGHRSALTQFIQGSLAIASEVQPASRDDLNSRDISSKITRVAQSYQDTVSVGTSKDRRQEMSRSHVEGGDRKLSQLTLINEERIIEGLKSVYREENTWAVISYVPDRKDEVQLQSVGSGLSSLASEVAADSVCFCLVSLKVTETTTTVTKFILLTWVGEHVKPLTKARTASHRKDLANWMITFVPFHSHYQANDIDELSEAKIMFKLRSG